jgi:hypothetical protein
VELSRPDSACGVILDVTGVGRACHVNASLVNGYERER